MGAVDFGELMPHAETGEVNLVAVQF